jgi:acetyl/propionyl-CoA carboxylase alpha subunit
VIRVECGGEVRELAAHAERGTWVVRVDGRPQRLAMHEVAPGSFVLEAERRSEIFHCVREGDDVHLFWRGVAYRLRLLREGARPAQRQAGGALETPMPGRVIRVAVEPGQRVARGDVLLIVEAMKMENALRAPRDGRVKAVSARVGEMVNPGVVLVELE